MSNVNQIAQAKRLLESYGIDAGNEPLWAREIVELDTVLYSHQSALKTDGINIFNATEKPKQLKSKYANFYKSDRSRAIVGFKCIPQIIFNGTAKTNPNLWAKFLYESYIEMESSAGTPQQKVWLWETVDTKAIADFGIASATGTVTGDILKESGELFFGNKIKMPWKIGADSTRQIALYHGKTLTTAESGDADPVWADASETHGTESASITNGNKAFGLRIFAKVVEWGLQSEAAIS